MDAAGHTLEGSGALDGVRVGVRSVRCWRNRQTVECKPNAGEQEQDQKQTVARKQPS